MCANCHLTELFKAHLSYIRPTASEVTTLWQYRAHLYLAPPYGVTQLEFR